MNKFTYSDIYPKNFTNSFELSTNLNSFHLNLEKIGSFYK